MSSLKTKYWINHFLNQISQETGDVQEQVKLIRTVSNRLATRAGALELAALKELDHV